MDSAARVSKLAELRAKTDRELAKIIDNQLQRAMHLARAAEAQKPANDPDSVKPLGVQAEEICAGAMRLLTLVEDPHNRRQLETKYNSIRQRLSGPADARRRTWASAYC